MESIEKRSEKEPELPQDTSAAQILNEYSGKQIAALADGAGMTREAFERFLQKRARSENVAKTVQDVQKQIASGREKTEYDKQAEEAVLQGIKEMRAAIERPNISEHQEEQYYSRAYEQLNKIEYAETEYDRKRHRLEAVRYFGYAIRARAIRDLFEQVRKGMPFTESKRVVVASFSESAKKQNIPELGEAYKQQAEYLDQEINMQRAWAAIDPLIQHYEASTMTQEDRDLLQSLVDCAKAAYFRGFEYQMIERFGLQGLDAYMNPVIRAYRKLGPHKRKSNNVSGPSEIYGSVQSGDRNSGYNRTGKARPHRGTPDDERF
ncbi:MAG TPA: hypothetical protein VJL39_00275 [Candidatus Paceibacterota bacterium]